MTLVVLSFFILAYIIASLIIPLPCRPAIKAALSVALLVISQKFLIYRHVGGLLFAPDLPRGLLLVMETLYSAMLFLFILLLIKDALTFLLWLSRLMGTSWHLPFPVAARSAGLALIALGLGIFGVRQATKVPEVRTVELSLPRLPESLDGFVLVQLSDIHIGPLLKKDWLRAVADKTNALNPDAVVVTGDFIDGSPAKVRPDITPLGELKARHGVYGITGNHEYYSNAKHWLPVFEELGVTMLHNEHKTLSRDGAELVIVGVPDRVEKEFGGEGPDLRKALRGAPDTARVLLAHRPEGAFEHRGVDLQLSGHTHGGLMFFLKPIIARYNDGFVNGLYDMDGMRLYVNPGTGLWNGFSCRIGVPSEITRFVLRAK